MIHFRNVELDVSLHLAILVMRCVDLIFDILLEIKHLSKLVNICRIGMQACE